MTGYGADSPVQTGDGGVKSTVFHVKHFENLEPGPGFDLRQAIA